MAMTVRGVVKGGVVVPESALPEGVSVRITLSNGPPGISPDLQAEFNDWERAGAGTTEMVERLAEEEEGWSELGMNRLEEEWDNPGDAIYDDWRKHYGV